jgi:predicted nucleic acid-binding protein
VIFVDSSVWIDYFKGIATPHSDRLDALLTSEPLATGDIVLAEVLQGFAHERDFDQALGLLASLNLVEVVGKEIAIKAARNFRLLRARGITVRKMVDVLIATRCIEDGHSLLYSDRDFDPFVAHLGLASANAD